MTLEASCDESSARGWLVGAKGQITAPRVVARSPGPSPRPSPGGRGRSIWATFQCVFSGERLRLSAQGGRIRLRRALLLWSVWARESAKTTPRPVALTGRWTTHSEIPETWTRVQPTWPDSTKKMHKQAAPLDRPLPPGEGRGEGSPPTSDLFIASQPLNPHALRYSAIRALKPGLRKGSMPAFRSI
jgi:hypothetical protein